MKTFIQTLCWSIVLVLTTTLLLYGTAGIVLGTEIRPSFAQNNPIPDCDDASAIKKWSIDHTPPHLLLSEMFGIAGFYGSIEGSQYYNRPITLSQREEFDKALADQYSELRTNAGRMPLSWALLQPLEKGPYQWEFFDQHLRWMSRSVSTPLVSLKDTPIWASSAPSDADQPERYPPTDINKYNRQLRAVISRYGSSGQNLVHHWEVWNEANAHTFFKLPPTVDRAESYQKLLSNAYRTIKETDPQATVLFTGIVSWQQFQPNSFTRQVLSINEGDPSFDIFNIHAYGDEEWLLNRACKTRKLLNSYGLKDTPIWITETGTKTSNRSPESAAADINQKYSIETLTALKSLGVEKLFWWSDWRNSLLTKDSNPNIAYQAYKNTLIKAREADDLCRASDLNCDGTTNLLDLLHWRREVATRETKERDLLDYLQILRGWFST